MRLFPISIDKVQKVFSLETLKSLIDDSLAKLSFYLIKTVPFVRSGIKERYKSFSRSKYFGYTKNFLFVFILCVIPILGVFIKDYITDQVSIANAYISLDKSLNMHTEEHRRLLHQLREKVLTEELYKDKSKMSHTLAELVLLESHSVRSPMNKLKGIRWITAGLKAIGLYGYVQNFNPNNFMGFLRVLEQEPNQIQMMKIENQMYLGMGIAEENEFKGYLLMPISFEGLKNGINSVLLSTIGKKQCVTSTD